MLECPAIEEQQVMRYELRDPCDAITTPSTTQSVWLAEVLRQLNAIRMLPDGWDSHGGDAIDSQIIAAAEELARSLAQFPSVPRPAVSPSTAGGVQFEWEKEGSYFEIHLEEPTQADCYFESKMDASERQFAFCDGDDVRKLVEYIDRVGG